MNTFRFLDFQVYKEAKLFYREMIDATRKFPREQWELGDQIRRCTLSICLNIAEGSAKRSDKDFNRYIEIALGSVNEAIAGLDIAHGEKLISEEVFQGYYLQAEKITKQLGGFSKKLRTK
ncbi:MAG TPA: four helix bundle protein [Xanthomonadales bacterium]|nr:four helix bundle protein [Xanthomonadales bacterium]